LLTFRNCRGLRYDSQQPYFTNQPNLSIFDPTSSTGLVVASGGSGTPQYIYNIMQCMRKLITEEQAPDDGFDFLLGEDLISFEVKDRFGREAWRSLKGSATEMEQSWIDEELENLLLERFADAGPRGLFHDFVRDPFAPNGSQYSLRLSW
jgi:hypothetical protein